MNFHRPTFLALLLTLLSATLPMPSADAQPLIDRRLPDRGIEDYRIDPTAISIDQAAQSAARRFNAKVLRVQRVMEGGREVYVIRLLNAEGKVWTVKVDAETGRMN